MTMEKWVPGHFCRKTFLPNRPFADVHFDERTLRQKDILPKGQLAENRETLGNVTRVSNFQLLCEITIVWSLPVRNGSLTVHNHIYYW